MTTFDARLRAALEPQYQLGEELTGGGMSRVFIATDRALGRRVVVKVLPPDLAAGVNRDRFRREIHLAAQLQHPHIVPLLAAGEQDEILYYTMPFIEGESLRERLKRGRLPVRDVVRILHDVVGALAYAHERGVIHRDIKPGNILTQDRHALVTDFGVAKAISASLPGTGMTSTGMAIGTPAYMAPEQLAADPAADHRVDLYAVGLLAYELLSGESPFASASPTATMAAQLTRDPAPIESLRGDVPPQLALIVGRCLAKQPERRPATAAALLDMLETVPVPSGHTTSTRVVRPLSPRSRRRLTVGGIAALLLASAAGAVALARSGDSEGATPVVTVTTDDAVVSDAELAATDTLGSSTAAPAGREALTREDSLAIARALRDQLSKAGTPASAAPAPRPTPDAGSAAGAVELAERERVMAEMRARLARTQSRLDSTLIDSLVKSSLSEWSRTAPMIYRFEGIRPPGVPGDSGVRVEVGVIPAERRAPRRVAVVEPPADRGTTSRVGRVVANALRTMLAGNEHYHVVEADAVAKVIARSRDVAVVGTRLGAEVVASVNVVQVPGDSVVVLIKLRDLTAVPAYSYRVAATGTVATDDLGEALQPVLHGAVGYLDEMAHAPRRVTLRTKP